MSQTRRQAPAHGPRHSNQRALTLTSSINPTVHPAVENRQIIRTHAPRSPTSSLFGGDNVEDEPYHYTYSRHHGNAGQSSNIPLIPPAGIAAQLLQDLRNEIEYLRRRVTEQDGEISRLRQDVGRSEGLQDAYQKLLQELEAMRTKIVVHDTEYGVPLGPQLDRADYRFIKYWFADDFKDGEMILDLDDEVYDGKLGFIEDERGRFVGVRIVNDITTLARLIFCQLVELGIWPRYWRRISIRAFALFAMRLYESYPFLRLCAGDWKARAIGRDQYSGWFNKNPELKALAASSSLPDLDDDEDDEEVAPARPKRRAAQDGAQRPRKRQRISAAQPDTVALPPAPPQPARLVTPPLLLPPPPPPPPPMSPLPPASPLLADFPTPEQEPFLSPMRDQEPLALMLRPSRNTTTPTPRSPGSLSPRSQRTMPLHPSPDLGDTNAARRLIAPIPQRLASPARDATPPPGTATRGAASLSSSTASARGSSATPAARSQASTPVPPAQSSNRALQHSTAGVPKGRIPPPLARAIAERQRLTQEQEAQPIETAPVAPVDAHSGLAAEQPAQPALQLPRPPLPLPMPLRASMDVQAAPSAASNSSSTTRQPAPPGDAPPTASSSTLRLPAPPPAPVPAAKPVAPTQSKGHMRTAPINRDSKDSTQQLKVLWRDELVARNEHPSNGAWSAFLASEEGKARVEAHKAAAKHN